MNQIAFILGAGCSVSAGIPCFRGDGGISKGPLKSLFNANFLNNVSFHGLCDWAYQCGKVFFEMIQNKKPTRFHQLLKSLEDRHCINSIFSMNIDHLEAAAGVKNCFYLHGLLGKLRCGNCYKVRSYTRKDLMSYQRKFRVLCKCKRSKRSKHRGLFLPDLFLYNDSRINPEANNALATSQSIKPDCIIIVGTSLSAEVYGLHMILKSLLEKDLPCFFVNVEPPPARYKTKMIHLKMSSDEFADKFELQRIKTPNFMKLLPEVKRLIKSKSFAKFTKEAISKKHPQLRPHMETILQYLVEDHFILRVSSREFKQCRTAGKKLDDICQ